MSKLKLRGMNDQELWELVQERPIGGGGWAPSWVPMGGPIAEGVGAVDSGDSIGNLLDGWFGQLKAAQEEKDAEARARLDAIDPYKFETPEQKARRGALGDLLANREQYLGQLDQDKFNLRFDPMMGKLQDAYDINIRGYDESMAERGLLPQGSFAEGEDFNPQYSSSFNTGRKEMAGEFAEETGRIAQQAQSDTWAQQVNEYLALLSGYSDLNITPGQTVGLGFNIEQLLANIMMNRENIAGNIAAADAGKPDEPGMFEF